jgi:hypothetical protein
MVKNLVRAFGLAAVLGLAAGPAVASAPAALAASSHPVAVAAPAASAVHAAPAERRFTTPPDGDSICTYVNDNYCLTGEGSGNQIMTEITGISAWNFSAATHGYKIKPVSNSGICLQGFGSGNSYHVEEQSCQSGNGQQWWVFDGTIGHFTMVNWTPAGNMGVFDPNSARPVYDEVPVSGFYYNWQG